MSTETVSLSINGREYQIKIQGIGSKQVQQAGENITSTLAQLQKQYKVSDKNELLNMAIIKIATDYERLMLAKEHLQSFADKINIDLNQKINSYLDTE